MGSPLGPSFPYPFLARFEKNWLQNYPTNFRMIQIWRPWTLSNFRENDPQMIQRSSSVKYIWQVKQYNGHTKTFISEEAIINFDNLQDFDNFHSIIHIKYDSVISLLVITFQKTVWCQDSIWKCKKAGNLTTFWPTKMETFHKKWSFPLSISSVNVTKCAASCGFGHIYWRNP